MPVNPGSLVINVGRFSNAYTFVLPEASAAITEKLTLTITDVYGRKVWSKSVAPSQSAGAREISWNGLNSKGRKVSSGMYLVGVKVSGQGVNAEAVRLEVRQD